MNISQKDRRALILCGAFLGVVGVYMGLIDPFVVRYDAARERITVVRKKLSKLRRKKKLLRPRQRKLRSVRAEVEKMLSLFSGEVDADKRLGACIRDFQKAAADSGATLHSIRPLPTGDKSDPNFDAYRFELDFSGSYGTVMRMLYNLEAGMHLHRTRKMDLKMDKGVVHCRILAERYYYNPEPVVKTEEEKEGEES